MLDTLKRLFDFILRHFEQNSEHCTPARWKRPIVCVLSLILLGLATAVPIVAPGDVRAGAWLPTLVFGSMGFVGLVVGLLGSQHAVAKMLGGR